MSSMEQEISNLCIRLEEIELKKAGMLAQHRGGPLYNDGAFLSLHELLDTFADPFWTVAIIDVFYIDSKLINRRVFSKDFQNGNGRHAEEKAVTWLETILKNEPPDEHNKSGFVSIRCMFQDHRAQAVLIV